MNFIKKQSVGAWMTLGLFLLALVSTILYGVNGTMKGYFQLANSGYALALSILAVIFAAGALVIAQFKFEGILGKIMQIVADVLRFAAVIFLAVVLLNFISTRAQGLAYIFFSDENVLSEIQTPANMASANVAITGFIFYGIAWLLGIVSVFFKLSKKEA